jgi:hypothetical protein
MSLILRMQQASLLRGMGVAALKIWQKSFL